ncbi:tetratricopeptide repeat protein [Geminisphaera colitermitum]|uniref:tetratricopeptide repeat protein n=1 Tax=Geminisphaera colitermitum TaxID=1148786 RepID=UPI0009DDCD97|nr:tetratricopeptide repeat protein [Geminisphaera colitermitum]
MLACPRFNNTHRPARTRRVAVALTTTLLLLAPAFLLAPPSTFAQAKPAAPVIPQIPFPQILAEAENNITQRRPADAAALLDRVLSRVAEGEKLPQGADINRIRLTAATTHFQSQNFPRAIAIAQQLADPKNRDATDSQRAEARMIHGLSLALQQKYADAIPIFRAAEQSIAHRDKALLYGAMSAQQASQLETAAATYTRLLTTAAHDRDWADAALSLISIRIQQKKLPDARNGLDLLRKDLPLVDNLAGLNILSLQLGDALLAAGDPAGALTAYRTVLDKAELLRQQSHRTRRLETGIERAKLLTTADASTLDALRRAQARLDQIKTAAAEIEKLKNYDATLLFRLGTAFQQRGGAWEAAIVFEEIITRHPTAPERENAYYGLVRAYSDAGRFDKTSAAAGRFINAYPNSQFAPQALYLAAMAAGQRKLLATQLEFLGIATKRFSQSELAEPMTMMKANALFSSGLYAEAGQTCREYLATYTGSQAKFREDATYLGAMATLAEGRITDAAGQIETYLKTYPAGRFASDAAYRLAATDYARQNNDAALKRTQDWLATAEPGNPQRGEVASLQGDILATLGRTPEAITAYRTALEYSLSDDQLGYILDELTRLYQSTRDFESAIALWENFAREHPDHPLTINAAYWIARLNTRLGRTDAALTRVSEIAARYITEPDRDSVERLLVELSALIARPPRAIRGQPKPTVPTLDQLFARVDKELLVNGSVRQNPTAQARALFVQSEIANFRKNPARSAEILDRLAALYPIDTLPPGILGKLGDHMLAKTPPAPDLARACYTRIVTAYPKSIFADFGYAGLGQLALRDGNGEDALQQFNNAIDLAGARFKLLDATLGRARALLLLNRLDDAKDLYEQVAGNRTWRGEATAESVYSLGQIFLKRGTPEDLAQAQARFQRVYISYKKWTPWVAKSYLGSADAFEKLGQKQEAINTLREMLRQERLASLPETATARQRLAVLE